MKREWEPVNDELRRIRVPGGWLYESYKYVLEINGWEAYAVTFVPLSSQRSRMAMEEGT